MLRVSIIHFACNEVQSNLHSPDISAFSHPLSWWHRDERCSHAIYVYFAEYFCTSTFWNHCFMYKLYGSFGALNMSKEAFVERRKNLDWLAEKRQISYIGDLGNFVCTNPARPCLAKGICRRHKLHITLCHRDHHAGDHHISVGNISLNR